jgi:hypothetical protein
VSLIALFKLCLRFGLGLAHGARTRFTNIADAVTGIGKEHLLFIGDSHTQMFQYIKQEKLLREFSIQTVVVPGATAQGMVNPNSRTNALEFFKRIVGKRQYRAIFIQLGEVDCGFVIWYRCMKHGESVEYQLERSLENYFNFVKYLVGKGHEQVVLTGAILPTIKDNGVSWGEVAHLRKEVQATRKERTDLTLRYNDSLKRFARKIGVSYIDITSYILDVRTGLISDEYLNENPYDHHLSASKVAPFWVREIEQCLDQNLTKENRRRSSVGPS